MNEPNEDMIKEFERSKVFVMVGDEMITLTYYTKHGEEKNEGIPRDIVCISDWLEQCYDNYDINYETHVWLDEFGHGKDGAPHDIEDILEDQKEWEEKLYELFQIARKYENK